MSRWLRWTSLTVLLLQTTALVLVMRYSRTQNVEEDRYITSTAVALVEVLKIIMCFVLLFFELGKSPVHNKERFLVRHNLILVFLVSAGFNLVHVVQSVKAD